MRLRREWKKSNGALIGAIKELIGRLGYVPRWTEAKAQDYGLVMAAYRAFGSWRLALKAVGYPEYPRKGNERWRCKTLRQMDRAEVASEIASSVNPSRGAVWALLKEKGFHRDPLLVTELQRATNMSPETRPCARCGNPILPPKKYCDPCRVVVIREQTKVRLKRFFSKEENRVRYAQKSKEYAQAQRARRKTLLTPEEREKLRARWREYYARKKAENPEFFRLKARARYWREKFEALKKTKKALNNSSDPPPSPKSSAD